MAKTYKPKRFTDIGLLKRLDFPLLIRLLEKHKSFFEAQVGFAWTHDPAEFSFDSLAKIMMNLDTVAPMELLESLYFIEQLSDDEYFDDLLEIARKHHLDHDVKTVQDLALLLQLECPDEVQQYHAFIHRNDAQKRVKRFESYFSASEVPKRIRKITTRIREQMEIDLNLWAQEHKRGIGMRVFVTQEDNAVWFLIRHGQPMKRENTVTETGGNQQVFYRPEKFDIAIYYPDSDELAIGVRTKGQRLAYAEAIGRYCFGDEKYFSMEAEPKYTLAPLHENGVDALYSSIDIPEIEKVTLYELHIAREGKDNFEMRRFHDLFQAFESERRDITTEKGIELIKAKFLFHYSDKRTRIVTVMPPNTAIYDREAEHDLVHAWLVSRGFIIVKQPSPRKAYHDQSRSILENS